MQTKHPGAHQVLTEYAEAPEPRWHPMATAPRDYKTRKGLTIVEFVVRLDAVYIEGRWFTSDGRVFNEAEARKWIYAKLTDAQDFEKENPANPGD